MKYKNFALILLQQISFPHAKRIQQECLAKNKVCNSLSGSSPKSFEEDFSDFKDIVRDQKDDVYSDSLLDQYIGTTETIFNLYSLCHESYPECRKNGESCHCNEGLKEFFETSGYLSFSECRKRTKVPTRKGQGSKFFKASFSDTSASDACDINDFQNSKFIKQYWNSIMSENSKKQILEYCKDSLVARQATVSSTSKPDRFCLRVGRILKKFRFRKDKLKKQDQKSTFFGVGLIAYCGACECCTERPSPDKFLSAAKKGDIVLLRNLYKEFPTIIQSRDTDKNNALTLAAINADKDTVQFLIEELGMDETETGIYGRNCFLLAAEQGKIETMKYLNIKFPQLKNERADDDGIALTLASRFADVKTVQFLIEELGLDASETGYGGRNCFLVAAQAGKIETMKYLNRKFPGLKNERADLDCTALSLASELADTKTVQFLIEEIGFDAFETGYSGRNCFLVAAQGGKIETMKYLNKKFPQLKNERGDDDTTALFLAVQFDDIKTVQFLIEELGLDVTETGFGEKNCFMAAAECGKIGTMIYLDSIASDLKNGIDSDRNSALILAAGFGNQATVAFLIDEFKFVVDFKGWNGQNCYLNAAYWGNIDTFKYLHRRFPELRNSRDYNGKSALEIAQQRSQSKISDFLVGKS